MSDCSLGTELVCGYLGRGQQRDLEGQVCSSCQRGSPALLAAPSRASGTLAHEHRSQGWEPGVPGAAQGPGSAGTGRCSVNICGRREAKSALTGTLVLPTWQHGIGPLELSVWSDAFSGTMKFGVIWFGLLFHISAMLA